MQHPNIVAIHEVGVHEGHHYFSMDFVEGQNLAERARDNPMPVELAADNVKTVAEAIHHAHQHGVLHRDLKPSNVVIDSLDRPRITDFGLAKRLRTDSDLTVTGQILGSPNYMPPEQADPKRGQVSTASDVYSLGAILYHHMGGVLYADFSPDGRQIVTASKDKTARLWDAGTGQPIGRPITNQSEIYFACFSPNGKQILVASVNQKATIYDGTTKSKVASFIHLLRGSDSAADFPQFSPGGDRLVTLDSMAVALRDVRKGRSRMARLPHDDEVTSAVFSPDGNWAATASFDNTARTWNAHTGQAVTAPLRHDNWVVQVRFSADGTRLLTSARDQSARIWNTQTGRAITEPLRAGSCVRTAEFSPDGERVVITTDGDAAWLWDVRFAQPGAVTLRHAAAVRHALFSPDGQRVATASWDDTVVVWDAHSGKPLTDPFTQGPRAWFVQFSPDRQRLAMASDGGVQVVDILTGNGSAGHAAAMGMVARLPPVGQVTSPPSTRQLKWAQTNLSSFKDSLAPRATIRNGSWPMPAGEPIHYGWPIGSRRRWTCVPGCGCWTSAVGERRRRSFFGTNSACRASTSAIFALGVAAGERPSWRTTAGPIR